MLTKLSHIRCIAVLLTMVTVLPVILAQSEKDFVDNRDFLKWQNRVNNLTSEIVGESFAVSDSERSLYLALLAKAWWKVDESEAREYLKKAADKLLSSIQTDDKTDRAKKIKFIQKALQVIAGLDEKLSQSLIGKIEAASGDDDDSRKEDPEMADLFAKLGLQVAQTNPQMALAAGMDSLNYGRSRDMPRLIFEIYAKDNKLGETLLRRALLMARGIYSDANSGFVANIGNYIFDSRQGRIISDPLRRSYLELYAELVAGAAEIESERQNRCMIAFFAPTILPRIDEYLPELSQTFRQRVQVCIPYLSAVVQETSKAKVSGDEPKTADEYVRAARATSDRALKAHYFFRALAKLEEAKKFDEIISLLDDMNEDEVKVFGGEAWDDRRSEYTYQSCRAYYKSKDMPAFYRVINRTPKRLRPYVRFRMREDISPVKDREFYLENAEEIGKDLKSLEIKPIYVASNYLVLTDMYIKVQPTEAEKIFRDAVKAINIVDGENPDYDPVKDYYSGMDVIPLAAELLEIDEISITNSLANISSRRSRVRLKLGLLEPSLKKYVDEKKKLADKAKAKAIKDSQQLKTEPAKKP